MQARPPPHFRQSSKSVNGGLCARSHALLPSAPVRSPVSFRTRSSGVSEPHAAGTAVEEAAILEDSPRVAHPEQAQRSSSVLDRVQRENLRQEKQKQRHLQARAIDVLPGRQGNAHKFRQNDSAGSEQQAKGEQSSRPELHGGSPYIRAARRHNGMASVRLSGLSPAGRAGGLIAHLLRAEQVIQVEFTSVLGSLRGLRALALANMFLSQHKSALSFAFQPRRYNLPRQPGEGSQELHSSAMLVWTRPLKKTDKNPRKHPTKLAYMDFALDVRKQWKQAANVSIDTAYCMADSIYSQLMAAAHEQMARALRGKRGGVMQQQQPFGTSFTTMPSTASNPTFVPASSIANSPPFIAASPSSNPTFVPAFYVPASSTANNPTSVQAPSMTSLTAAGHTSTAAPDAQTNINTSSVAASLTSIDGHTSTAPSTTSNTSTAAPNAQTNTTTTNVAASKASNASSSSYDAPSTISNTSTAAPSAPSTSSSSGSASTGLGNESSASSPSSSPPSQPSSTADPQATAEELQQQQQQQQQQSITPEASASSSGTDSSSSSSSNSSNSGGGNNNEQHQQPHATTTPANSSNHTSEQQQVQQQPHASQQQQWQQPPLQQQGAPQAGAMDLQQQQQQQQQQPHAYSSFTNQQQQWRQPRLQQQGAPQAVAMNLQQIPRVKLNRLVGPLVMNADTSQAVLVFVALKFVQKRLHAERSGMSLSLSVFRNTVAPRVDGRNGFVFELFLMPSELVGRARGARPWRPPSAPRSRPSRDLRPKGRNDRKQPQGALHASAQGQGQVGASVGPGGIKDAGAEGSSAGGAGAAGEQQQEQQLQQQQPT